ncbi:Gfo/Idh/MocA family oxidoreductase [Roseobacter sp. YSTF-M11]|uniref:Gfo/Idh/MocA family oxidoreductase n=1 Tax=Roseobacter insulae TaxID=2859783 RepID=A0A9X1JX07_9RHOB|nr:Gfo/Idh/MocA family oxidoreductase [Roseobacter insulae]MBW4706486.1 Gfo/Idh/MocA family oxidoreductase [Roseobacter insulae]
MTRKSRILVVGGGLIGIRHVQAVEAHPECTLVGLADPDMSLAPEVPRFADMSDVDQPVDGVIIATPTGLHAPHGIYAAERGWHMLIEKPVASDLPGARALSHAVARAAVGSLVGHHRRYHRKVQQLRELIAGNAIGTPVCANLIWAMRKPDAYFEGNWRAAGGSPVLINLVHDIDILRFVIGEIATATALRGRGLRGDTRIESGAVALAFESGATGTISFADTAPSPWGFEAATGENPNIGTTGQDMMWLMGTKGAISFPSMTLWSGSDWGQPAVRMPLNPAENIKAPLDAQLDHFIQVIGGAAPLIDVADATRTLETALTIEAHLSEQVEGVSDARNAHA